MLFRQLLNEEAACASYLLGCKTHGQLAVVDPHAELVDAYLAQAERHGAAAYLPADAGVAFDHVPLADGETVRLGNVELEALATPGHAWAHHAYLVTDRTRGGEPWLVLTGDALLVGDAGRPDLHADDEHGVEQMACLLYRSLTERLLRLPDDLLLYPAHFSGSVCGRGLSANPASTIDFERRHNSALQHGGEEAFVAALTRDIPPAPKGQAAIVAANRAGRSRVEAV